MPTPPAWACPGVSTCAAAWLKTATPGSAVGVEDLARFADVFADLADPDVMSQAWK